MKENKEYLNLINKIANQNIPNKHNVLSEILTKYYKNCYENNIKPTIDIFELGPKSYIIESTPLIIEINDIEAENAFLHLKEVIQNNEQELIDGISLEEANIILNWVIQNARKSLSKHNAQFTKIDFLDAPLTGVCGYAQSLTLLPFIELNLEITINNASHFPNATYRHAFGTVKIPIKHNDKVAIKQYLLDASYRQFFTTAECNKGRFYLTNPTQGPSLGYYICQTEEGKKFATELLKNGFVELTEENAKMYGYGFECESLTLNNLKNQEIIKNTPKEIYLEIINKFQEPELNNDKEELEEYGDIIIPPGIRNNKIL